MVLNFKTSFLFLWVIMSGLGCGGRIYAMDPETKRPARGIRGGPCEYKIYKGSARVISVCKKETPKRYGGPSYESYDVRFCFFPGEEIKEPHLKFEGKEYPLMLTNSWHPGPKFLKKYGIEQDKRFECHLKVIIRGTCTPVIFDFPSINLSDYFEHKK